MKYDIIYSKRKTISLVIKDGKLIVRAPIGAKKEIVDKLISDHKGWIEKT